MIHSSLSEFLHDKRKLVTQNLDKIFPVNAAEENMHIDNEQLFILIRTLLESNLYAVYSNKSERIKLIDQKEHNVPINEKVINSSQYDKLNSSTKSL